MVHPVTWSLKVDAAREDDWRILFFRGQEEWSAWKLTMMPQSFMKALLYKSTCWLKWAPKKKKENLLEKHFCWVCCSAATCRLDLVLHEHKVSGLWPQNIHGNVPYQIISGRKGNYEKWGVGVLYKLSYCYTNLRSAVFHLSLISKSIPSTLPSAYSTYESQWSTHLASVDSVHHLASFQGVWWYLFWFFFFFLSLQRLATKMSHRQTQLKLQL